MVMKQVFAKLTYNTPVTLIKPAIHIQNPTSEYDLNYERKEIQTALINAHGFGGRLT